LRRGFQGRLNAHTWRIRGVLLGAASGTAGTRALNAATHVDVALQGRRANSTSEDNIEKIAQVGVLIARDLSGRTPPAPMPAPG
jgi:hypothetical protein